VSTPLLTTKLFSPPIRSDIVPRPRLIEHMNIGLSRKLTLLSAPAGFGKTTLLSSWIAQIRSSKIAWLSLDEADNDLKRFLTYIVAALQTIETNIGQGAMPILQSPGAVNLEMVLTTLINEIANLSDEITLILDDYHVIESPPIDQAITFLLDHLPLKLHVVIASRIDPTLALSRMRAQGQLTELRVANFRFTSPEINELFNQVMKLNISVENIAALESRTEGWIAGLQLAAISIKGSNDVSEFIRSFSGSHRLVLDYLIEEVLSQQPENIQTFLVQTSILDRLTGPLCDAITGQENGQATLELLDRANLFIVPLDDERCWYRYHHLFADLLRQRLHQIKKINVRKLHTFASVWHEDQGLEIEAFHHATAANDVERAEYLIEGGGVPLQYRGAAALVLSWLASRPMKDLDSRPSLWVTYASALNLTGQPEEAEKKLQAAESALINAAPMENIETNNKTNDIIGHIAAIRAMMAVRNNQVDIIIDQSSRALEYLHPNNLTVRTITTWTLGYAYQLQGDREAASKAYTEVLSNSQKSGDIISTLAAATGLGQIHVSENQLYPAADCFQLGLSLFGDNLQPIACETILGLAKIRYEWDDMGAAEKLGQQSIQLARQLENIDTFAICGAFLAQLKLAQGDATGVAVLLKQADQFLRKNNLMDRMFEVVAVRVQYLLHQGDLVAAARLADEHELPLSRARVYLAKGDASAAQAVLESYRQQVEAMSLEDQLLKVMVLQALAHQANRNKDDAVLSLNNALVLAEPGGFIRTFVDEGAPMEQLLHEVAEQAILPDYTCKIVASFENEKLGDNDRPNQPLNEPLSPREMEVLHLIADGLSNRQISERLFLAIDTVKGHNRKIFSKLGVQNRTEAVARARRLGLL